MVHFIPAAWLEWAAWNHPMVVHSREVDEKLLTPIRGGSAEDRRPSEEVE